MENEKYYRKFLSTEIFCLVFFVALTPLIFIDINIIIKSLLATLLLSADFITLSNIIRKSKEFKKYKKSNNIINSNIEIKNNEQIKEKVKEQVKNQIKEKINEQSYLKNNVLDKPKVLEKELKIKNR